MTLARRAWSRAGGVALLAVLTYLPALSAGHGRMPADTKLYLYLDPGRLVGDAPYTFDPRQFAGWVPHQTISYLWPSGPWYWLFDQAGVPDWLAHRLWIGTVLFLAALGVRWCAGVLGIRGWAAVAAGAMYGLTPFVLPYLSRTSLMLLPFAGLGWIVGLTVLAATRSTWRHAALLALVLATVAAPNATAIAMIAPAPVLWLLTAAVAGTITWRRAAATTARIAVLGLAVCAWWIAMLSVQGRVGADVLAYSETLEAVSLTSASTETLRGLGYWLFYIRDPVGFATSAAERYMASGRLVAVTVAVTAVGMAGLALTRFAARRFAIALVIVGTTLAIGVHPIDDPPPLFAPFADSSRSTFVLALRSSTRALPMTVLGLALGAAALAGATGRVLARSAPGSRSWRPVWAAAPALAVVLLVVVNLPAAWTRGFVDPDLDRDQDPPSAWVDAAATLDDRADTRVLQLPGQEFGAFRWGYTADPPLPGLTERPLVTRDLLPLGSPAAMDLLYALDDRFQEGTAERAAIAPLARLFGASTVWLTNDIWFDRYRSPRPELTASLVDGGGDGIGAPTPYGEPAVAEAVVPSVDERSVGDPRVGTPLAPVWLSEVDAPETVIRAKSDTTLVVGSGDGVVDAAAAGLIDGSELLVYAGAPGGPAPGRLIVTDSNRDQARQWRSSQDTRGFTESGGPDTDVLRPDTADQRLAVQSDAAADQTVALQDGPVTARATAYGEPFAYRPEDRAAMAIDGDPATAWRVADRADAVGEAIELTSDEPLTTLELVQPGLGVTGRPVTRWITAVDVAVDDAEPVRVTLDERSRAEPGQRVDLPTAGRRVRLTVAETAEALREGAGPDAVGFAEIRTGRGPTTEIVRVPSIPATGAPTDVVLTRWRVDPADRWRHDPEPTLRRRLDLPTAITGAAPTATVRLDPRASDRAIADLLGADVAVASARLTGMPNAGGWAATDGDPATAWIGPFDVADGLSVTVPVAAGTIDTLRLRQPGGDTSPITKVRLTGVGGPVEADVPPADAEGWSTLVTGGLAVDTVLTIELVDVDVRTTRDRRSAEVVGLPVAIAELEGAGITPRPLPDTVSFGCRDDLVTVDGEPLAVDLGSPSTEALIAGDPVVAGACDAATVDLPAGTVEIATAPGALTALDVDRIVLRDPRPTATTPRPSIELLERGRLHRVAEVGACPDGCWIVLGEGLNPGWSASLDGASLGDPVLVDGGFHGWWLEPAAQPRTVRFEWGEQRPVTLGLAISAVAVAVCIVLAVADRRRRPTRLRTPPRLAGIGRETGPGITGSRWWAPAPLAAVVALALLGPVWAAAAAVLGLVAGRLGRPRLLAVAGLAIWIGIGLLMVRRVVVYAPFPGPGWPGEFADLHDLGVFVLALLAGSLSAPDRRPRVGSIPLS